MKLEVSLTCGDVVSEPVSVTSPTNNTPVIYDATFPSNGCWAASGSIHSERDPFDGSAW